MNPTLGKIEDELQVDRVSRKLLDEQGYVVSVCCGKCHRQMLCKLSSKGVPAYYHGTWGNDAIPACVNANKVFYAKPLYLESIDPDQWEELGIEGEKPVSTGNGGIGRKGRRHKRHSKR